MAELLVEIGCEEIPARALGAMLPRAEQLLEERLKGARLTVERLRVLGTPRRIAFFVWGVPPGQPDTHEELVGPPVSAGKKAAEGFAAKVGVPVHTLGEKQTDKGSRLFLERKVAGKPALEVLPELLLGLIGAMPWPKSMRWGSHSETFVRPVRWLVCLLGDQVVPFELAGVSSGRMSRGHRFLGGDPFEVHGITSYIEELRRRFVIVDPKERRQLIVAELGRIERETGLRLRKDEDLLEEVTYLVEYPVALSGEFDSQYLTIPQPVIVSAMRSHQRYFAIENPDGTLANKFVTIAGTVVKDARQVIHGNERVLSARLADARFFFDEDSKVSLSERVQKLSGIVWIKGLGTMKEKVDRLGSLAESLAKTLGIDPAKAVRAAALAKADLATHLVGEFPDLQGHIGRAYAQAAGEDPEVAQAIAEHYQPRGSGDAPASSGLGAVLALADRADSLVGCFAAGLEPTGSADPYGLRRAALGLLATLMAHGWHVVLPELFAAAGAKFGKTHKPMGETIKVTCEFVRARLRGVLSESFPSDVAGAVLAASSDDPVDARDRAQALAALVPLPEFEPLGIAIKRVGNILKGVESPGRTNASLLKDPAEQALAETQQVLEKKVLPLLSSRRYDQALRTLAEFKTPVDTFFDKVFVMDKDAKVRRNRLALLSSIHELFLRVADFRELNLG